MDSLTGYVATGLVMLIVGLLLRELEPKVKVVWWSPHQFRFELPQPPNILLTHAITIQGYPGTTAGPSGAGESALTRPARSSGAHRRRLLPQAFDDAF